MSGHEKTITMLFVYPDYSRCRLDLGRTLPEALIPTYTRVGAAFLFEG
jgi:hypothetical protein